LEEPLIRIAVCAVLLVLISHECKEFIREAKGGDSYGNKERNVQSH